MVLIWCVQMGYNLLYGLQKASYDADCAFFLSILKEEVKARRSRPFPPLHVTQLRIMVGIEPPTIRLEGSGFRVMGRQSEDPCMP